MPLAHSFEDAKDPAEKIVLTFDFGKDLDPSERVIAPPEIEITVVKGDDENPDDIRNGEPSPDPSVRKWLIPIKDGVAGCKYHIKVSTPTSNDSKLLTLAAILTVVTF